MPSSQLLQEHTSGGSVCAVCGGYCDGSPPLDRSYPIPGDRPDVYFSYQEAAMADGFVITPEQIWENETLLYGVNARVPLAEAKRRGLDVSDVYDGLGNRIKLPVDKPAPAAKDLNPAPAPPVDPTEPNPTPAPTAVVNEPSPVVAVKTTETAGESSATQPGDTTVDTTPAQSEAPTA